MIYNPVSQFEHHCASCVIRHHVNQSIYCSHKICFKAVQGWKQPSFFSRHHPLHALKNWRDAHGRRPTVDLSNVAINHFKPSYVYEMICLLVPRFRDWDVINSLVSEVDFKIGPRDYPIGFPVDKRDVV